MLQTRILIIDDDQELCELLTAFLTKAQFIVHSVHDGKAGLKAALNQSYDLIILDIMLPSMDGLSVLRKLQAHNQIPVLMLTARGEEVDKIMGLEIGADDYVAKPCSPRELVARLRAILRRVEKSRETTTQSIEKIIAGNLTIDVNLRTVSVGDQRIQLTVTEFELLLCLCLQINQVLTKEMLYQKVLGRPIELYDRSLDMHISHLRHKLAQCAGSPEIKTVRGVGYLIACDYD